MPWKTTCRDAVEASLGIAPHQGKTTKKVGLHGNSAGKLSQSEIRCCALSMARVYTTNKNYEIVRWAQT